MPVFELPEAWRRCTDLEQRCFLVGLEHEAIRTDLKEHRQATRRNMDKRSSLMRNLSLHQPADAKLSIDVCKGNCVIPGQRRLLPV